MPDVVSSAPSGDYRRRRLCRLAEASTTRASRSPSKLRPDAVASRGPTRPGRIASRVSSTSLKATNVSCRPPDFRRMDPSKRAARRRLTNVCNLLIQFSRNAHPRSCLRIERSVSYVSAANTLSAVCCSPRCLGGVRAIDRSPRLAFRLKRVHVGGAYPVAYAPCTCPTRRQRRLVVLSPASRFEARCGPDVSIIWMTRARFGSFPRATSNAPKHIFRGGHAPRRVRALRSLACVPLKSPHGSAETSSFGSSRVPPRQAGMECPAPKRRAAMRVSLASQMDSQLWTRERCSSSHGDHWRLA